MSHTETHSKKTRPATRRRRTPRLSTLRTSSKFTCSRPRGVYLFISVSPSFPPHNFFFFSCIDAASANSPHFLKIHMLDIHVLIYVFLLFPSIFFPQFLFSFLCIDALSADFSRLRKIHMLSMWIPRGPLGIYLFIYSFLICFSPLSHVTYERQICVI